MARVILPVTAVSRTGASLPGEADGDTANGHTVSNTGRTVIVVRNADTAAHTVTLVTPGTVDGQPIGDRAVPVPGSATRYFGRLPREVYGSQLAIDVDSAQLKLLALEP